MIRVSPRKRAVTFDALPAADGTKSRRRRNLPPATVAPEKQVSDVRVLQADATAARHASAAELVATAIEVRSEKPYKLYAHDDPRRRRGFDADAHGNLNIERTPNPRRDSRRRTGPDNGRQPAVDSTT